MNNQYSGGWRFGGGAQTSSGDFYQRPDIADLLKRVATAPKGLLDEKTTPKDVMGGLMGTAASESSGGDSYGGYGPVSESSTGLREGNMTQAINDLGSRAAKDALGKPSVAGMMMAGPIGLLGAGYQAFNASKTAKNTAYQELMDYVNSTPNPAREMAIIEGFLPRDSDQLDMSNVANTGMGTFNGYSISNNDTIAAQNEALFGGDTAGDSSYGGGDYGGAGYGDSGYESDNTGGVYSKGGLVNRADLRGPKPPGPDDGYGGLMHGEFVVKASTVKKLGPEKLKQLNAGKAKIVPRGK